MGETIVSLLNDETAYVSPFFFFKIIKNKFVHPISDSTVDVQIWNLEN